jgi:hypothetical protein
MALQIAFVWIYCHIQEVWLYLILVPENNLILLYFENLKSSE